MTGMTSGIDIGPLSASAETIGALGDMLVAVVAAGGSVSFMHPLDPKAARAFWTAAMAAAARDERVVLGASIGGEIVGTVSVLLDFPPNQPHRAEIAKLMVRPDRRGKGAARRLMEAAERVAAERNRTLLVLDTATEQGAGGLYDRLGFTLVGEIPDFALKPHGGLTGTLVYWKRIGAAARGSDGAAQQ